MTKTKKQKRYTEKQLAFLRAGYAKMAVRDLVPAFNKKFEADKTFVQLRSILKNHGITCGRKGKKRLHPGAFLYTPDQIKFLRKNYAGRTVTELMELYNARFGTTRTWQQIRSAVHNRGFINGRTGHFEKGIRPWNTGTKGVCKRNAGTFKKGNLPGNIKPLGHERICSKDGFILIKIAERNPYTGAPTRYKHKAVYIWEQAHGPVPKGFVVMFKDGNKLHCDLQNLVLLKRSELLRLNWKGYRKMPAELKPSLLALARMEEKMFTRAKKIRRAA